MSKRERERERVGRLSCDVVSEGDGEISGSRDCFVHRLRFGRRLHDANPALTGANDHEQQQR